MDQMGSAKSRRLGLRKLATFHPGRGGGSWGLICVWVYIFEYLLVRLLNHLFIFLHTQICRERKKDDKDKEEDNERGDARHRHPCVHIYIYIHIYLYTYIYTRTHIYVYVCVCTYIVLRPHRGPQWPLIVGWAQTLPWGRHEPQKGLWFIYHNRDYSSLGYMNPWSPQVSAFVPKNSSARCARC